MKKRIVETKVNNEFKILGLDISQLSLILVNLIPLFGVLFFGWELFNVLIVYWSETLVIIIFSIIKLISYNFIIKSNIVKNIILKITLSVIISIPAILFILLLYGMAMFFYLIFIFFTTNPNAVSMKGFPITIYTLKIIFQSCLLAFVIFMISHGISFYKNYIKKKEYKYVKDSKYFLSIPFYRIILIHSSIFLIIILAIALNKNFIKTMILSGIIFIIIKTILDLYFHNKEHNTYIFKK